MNSSYALEYIIRPVLKELDTIIPVNDYMYEGLLLGTYMLNEAFIPTDKMFEDLMPNSRKDLYTPISKFLMNYTTIREQRFANQHLACALITLNYYFNRPKPVCTSKSLAEVAGYPDKEDTFSRALNSLEPIF